MNKWMWSVVFAGLMCGGAVAEMQVKAYGAVPFDYIYPEINPGTLEPLSCLAVTLAKGEYEPATFLVRSSVDLPKVTAKINVPMFGMVELPAEAIELRVVKVWNQTVQLRMTMEEEPKIKRVPELLLTDDVMDPQESWAENKYIAPEFPRELRTQISAEQVKQFWVTVRAEPNTPAGLYEGSIELVSNGASFLTLPLKVEVLPYALPEPDKIYSIYFRAHVKPFDEKDYRSMSKERYLNELKSLKKHGFNSILFHEVKPENIREAYDRIQSVGFSGPIVLLAPDLDDAGLQAYADRVRKDGKQPWVYAIDEVGKRNMDKHLKLIGRIHKAGAKAMAAIRSDTCAQLDKTEPLDWANVSHAYIPITAPTLQFSGQPEKLAVWHPHEHDIVTYYWQCYMEDPDNNRRQQGFYLWRSGVGGTVPFNTAAYWGALPYHNDIRTFPVKEPTRKYRNFTTYYPAQGEPTPTLDYEALREGVDDMRYLRLVEQLLKDASRENQKMVEAALKEIVDPFYYLPRQTKALDLRVSPSSGHFAWARASLIEVIAFLRGETEGLTLPELKPTPFRWNRMEIFGLGAVEDTFIREDVPDTQGKMKYLSFGVFGEKKHRHALVRFDLSSVPSGRTVKSATFSLYANGFSYPLEEGDSISVSIHRVLQAWDSAECNWTHRTGKDRWDRRSGKDLSKEPEDSGEVIGLYKECALDVTDAVRRHLSHPSENYGFLLKFANEEEWKKKKNGITFSSQETDERNYPWWPKLIIEFEE